MALDRYDLITAAKRAAPYRRLGAISQEYNLDYYWAKKGKRGLHELMNNIAKAPKKTRTHIAKVYRAAYKKHPGSHQIKHVLEYIKRMNKASRKVTRKTRKVVI